MINALQEKQITDYLITQNLSLDILVEIRDHMTQQIIDLQLEENLSFNDAFSKAKESWTGEFRMVHYWLFFPTKIPLIARRIISGKYNNMLKKSLVVGILSLLMNILLVSFSNNEEAYTVLFRAFNGLFLLAIVGVWLSNFKMHRYMRSDFKYQGKCFYTLYQKNTGLMIGCALGMMQIVSKNGHYVYEFFKNADKANFSMVFTTLSFPFILQTFTVFALLNFYEHKKNLSGVQEFVKSTTSAQ
ncbi:hypothetical protein [Chryseobacterium sp. JK1]|uniref:hypothetical protein n=1 Tax=Chryseobacterium sp. JK1 TaxID=874294 RepID=UPI003D683CE1